MVEDRPDWLISRQRAWGVPLTLFVNKETGEILKDDAVNARIVSGASSRAGRMPGSAPKRAFLGNDHDAGEVREGQRHSRRLV